MAEKMMIIDGNSIVNRAFYGVPLLSDAQGRYTNAVYGFLNILFKLMDEESPDYLAVAFDLHAPTFRHKQFEGYKGTRKGMPEELRSQMPILKDVLKAMHIRMYEMEGFEADDILGTLSKKAEDAGILPVVVSGDRDLLQLAGEKLKIRIPKTKGGKTEIEDYYDKDVMEKYGVTPEEFIDVKALMGDASDNIPGVPGIGEKTAIKIIQQYHTLENAIEHSLEVKPKKASENILAFQEQARMSKMLATIVRNVPIDMELSEMGIESIFSEDAYKVIKELEFKSIFQRFQSTAQVQGKQLVYQIVHTEQEAEKAFSAIVKEEETAYIWIKEQDKCQGLALYAQNIGGYWLETSDTLSIEKIFALGKEFFQGDYKRIAHNAKNDIKLLRHYGFELGAVVFDTALAGYILNPTRDTYEYDDIAGEFLNEQYPTEEELLGKGKSKQSIFSLTEQERAEFTVRQAEVTFRGKKVMEERLKENHQEDLYYNIELPLLYVLADMEQYGIKINKAELKEYQKKLQDKIDTITAEIFALTGEEFNLNSPKQLGVILFDENKMGLKGGKKTKTGYSTSADVLEKLKYENPVIEKILLYRQYAKLKSTYADGLLAVMNEKTEKIYSTFNQTITATGRISSTEPNLQNIPVRLELGRELRKIFIPESDDYCFLDADYSQIELRVLAHISGDETLIQAFCQNQDIHRLTASQVFNVLFDEVTELQRRNAKAVNFGIVYGIGAFSLSQDLNITRKEAETYIEGYFHKYPKIKTYMDSTIAHAEENGYVSTMWNRRRYMPELQSKNFMQRSFGERVAMNMPIQGSAADIIKIAMVKVHRSLKEKGLKSRLILQVHDELLIETLKSEKEQVAEILKQEMEHAAELAAPLKADVHEGQTWFEAK